MLTSSLMYKNGIVQITTDINTEKILNANINKYEPQYLQYLLGSELYDLFLLDLDSNQSPQSTRFQEIYNPFVKYTANDSLMYNSIGFIELIKRVVNFYTMRQLNGVNTPNGSSIPNQETSRKNYTINNIVLYNEAISSIHAIQYYILENTDIYPEFKGVQINKIDNFLL